MSEFVIECPLCGQRVAVKMGIPIQNTVLYHETKCITIMKG